MNRIHEKRLKRKVKMEGRVECHGNKYSCFFHIRKPEVKQTLPVYSPFTGTSFKSKGWFRRLIDWIKCKF